MELWPWLWSDFSMLMIGGPEHLLLRYMESRLEEDAVVFEVGAYLAEYSFLAASRAGAGSAHAFEPHPESARRISEAIERSQLHNVHLSQVAVGERTGRLSFSLQDYPASSGLRPAGQSPTEEIEVAVTTLDEYCREARIERLDLLKIDVEGAELPVLRGGQQTIRRFRPEMIVELHGPESAAFGYEVRTLVEVLRDKLDYRLLQLKQERGLTGPSLVRFRYSPALERIRLNVIARPAEKSLKQVPRPRRRRR